MNRKNIILKTREEFISTFKEIYDLEKNNLEQSFHALKCLGASQMDCVKILIQELHLSLNEADEIVLNSKTWASYRDPTLKMRNDFADQLEQMIGEEE